MKKKPNHQLSKITYTQLKETLATIPIDEDRVLLKTIYATLGRVGEIVRPRYQDTYEGKGLILKSFEINEDNLSLSFITEKRNIVRTVPIARIDKPEHPYFKNNEAWITDDIINYLTNNSKEIPDGGRVWDYSTRWAELRFQKYFKEHGQHIHLLRHWRATHLLNGQATGKPVPMSVVAKMGGWDGTKVLSTTYDSSIIEDYWNLKE